MNSIWRNRLAMPFVNHIYIHVEMLSLQYTILIYDAVKYTSYVHRAFIMNTIGTLPTCLKYMLKSQNLVISMYIIL